MSQKTAEQDSTFLDAMKDVTPIRQDDRVSPAKPQHTLAQQLKRQALEKEQHQRTNYLSVEKVDPVDPLDMLFYKKPGVQDGVYKNLRLGKYQIDSRVNLQNMALEKARSLLFDSIVENHQRGVRTLLVQHGLGQHSKPFPALIKSYVKQWLQQMPEVLAFHSALKCHGGLAAVYVLLKKNRDEKQANREQHRRK